MREKAYVSDELNCDYVFLIATILLVILGTVMVYSSSFFVSQELYGSGMAMIKSHMLHAIVGAVLMFGLIRLDYRKLHSKGLILILLGLAMVSLALCFVPGIGVMGGHARRWINLRVVTLQSSEFVKLILILFLANFLSKKNLDITRFSTGILPVLIVMGAIALMIFAEPDFGTAATIGIWTLIVLFVAGMRWKHLLSLAALAVPIGIGMMVMAPYRRARLVSFLDPWQDMYGGGYQIIQSMVAFAKGGIFGVGLGEGTQKLFFLPAPHTDFILSSLGEELGFLGVFGVIALFGVWIWRGLKIAQATNDDFGFYLVVGSVTLIGLQAVLNMGVAMSVLPNKGLALPFFSCGGSTLVATMLISGLVLSVSRSARL
ncbi:MAG: Lipid II flippase FtsW [Deltaproteobacteria bacterium ADurb.Bin510]|nr:MAG: Lipid II flippase FtsW [Deltaproteobacteria bacterium ADurb.Bin510]